MNEYWQMTFNRLKGDRAAAIALLEKYHQAMVRVCEDLEYDIETLKDSITENEG